MEEKRKKKLKVWCLILIIFAGLFLLGTIFWNNSSNNTSNSNLVGIKGNSYSGRYLVILGHNLDYSDYGNLIVSGIAKNMVGKKLVYCEIDVKFYDINKIVIATFSDNIKNLEEDEIWRFEVYYLGTDPENVNSYKIELGSCW